MSNNTFLKKLINYFLLIFMIILFCVFQTTVFNKVSFAGNVPNIVLILVVSIGFIKGQIYGIVTGMLAGFFLDIISNSYIGINMFILLCLGYFSGHYNDYYEDKDDGLPILLILISTFINSIFLYVLNIMLYGNFKFTIYLKTKLIPEFVYTAIISLFVYKLIAFIIKKMEKTC